MAARLTVIISQSPIRHSQATDAEERLLTELMMTTGMDATLIGPLEQVQLDSTDYLCLSGFNSQSLAMVSTLSYEQVGEQWSRLQLAGQIVRVGQAAEVRGRRVYYFSLSSNTTAVMSALQQLLNDQTVKTVDVIMPQGKALRPILKKQAAETHADDSPSSTPPKAASPTRMHPAQANSRANSHPNDGPQWASSPASETEEKWTDLDQLVDDFDALDL